MKRTKIIGVLCSVLMSLTLLSACGGGQDNKNDTKENTITVKNVELSQEKPKINVKGIPELSDDFILGADVSTLIAQEKSGVKYYDETGNEADPILTLARNGINTIRIRVWNDPFDEAGNGYGGGNNDVSTAISIGKRATEYGLGVMIDFHYSDFWADPSKQMSPKKWADMAPQEKGEAAYEFTYDSLKTIVDNGVNVTLVQVGNETNNGIAGENKWSDMAYIFSGGSRAVRKVSEEFDKDILVVTHFTNPEKVGNLEKCAQMLWKFEIDYDVFATSYYPYWHGTTSNLTRVLTEISQQYDKKVMVAETSYAYTFDDGDGFANTVSAKAKLELPYEISAQGQADCIREIANAVVEVGENGIGIMYWEPAWIPVIADTKAEKENLWNQYGCGWASSYSAGYDPEDAGRYYGGCAWDNQALFDFEGKPLPSISVFRLLKSGTDK